MIEFLRILAANGDSIVQQRLVSPAVFLDTWAIIEFAENSQLGSRFRAALHGAGGTLALSPLTLVDFAGMDDPRHAELAGAFIGSLAPNLFFIQFDPFIVRSRELDFVSGATRDSPVGDSAWLAVFAEEATSTNMQQCVVEWFKSMYKVRADFRQQRADLANALFDGIDALRYRIDNEPGMARDVREPLKDVDRPRSTHALLRALIAEVQGDRTLPRTTNHAIDLLQCVVPAAYCEYVLLDAQWHARLTRIRGQMIEKGIAAPVAMSYTKRDNGIEAFLTAVESKSIARPRST